MSTTNEPSLPEDDIVDCIGECTDIARLTEGFWAGFLAPLDFIKTYMSEAKTLQAASSMPLYEDIKFPQCYSDDDRHVCAIEDFVSEQPIGVVVDRES